jgi:hypothetical protein
MTQASFATPSDLASFLQIPAINPDTAQLLLDMASDAIREEVGQDIVQYSSTETYDGPSYPGWNAFADAWQFVQAPNTSVLFLRQTPVTSIASLTENGVALVQGTDYAASANGAVTRMNAGWYPGPNAVVVTYTHGWGPDSNQLAACKRVCVQAAARAFVNPQQAESLQLGAMKVTYPHTLRAEPNFGRTGRIELTDSEMRSLDCCRWGVVR